MLEKAPKVRVIGRAGVGVDNIDVEAATRRGIVVMNTPGANAVAVAELAIGMMISLARHLARADASTRAGKWEKKTFQGTELRGKELGILGLGRIGVEVAKRAKALGMTVSAHDPYVSPALARDLGLKLCSLDDLYAGSDYLSLHLGLTPQTQGMINAGSLAMMKKGVRIVNCARGELVDEAALCAALRSGQVAGAALDVFVAEPPKNSPLLELPNLIATPHIGASTAEAQDAVGVQLAEQVREYLKNGVVQNAVNVPSLTEVEYQQLHPYLDLARRMASLLAQLMDSDLNLEEIRIGYEGNVGEWKTAVLRDSAVAGVLQCGSQEVVNIVNAATVAATRGVSIREDSASETCRADQCPAALTEGQRHDARSARNGRSREVSAHHRAERHRYRVAAGWPPGGLFQQRSSGRDRRHRHDPGEERHQHRALLAGTRARRRSRSGRPAG